MSVDSFSSTLIKGRQVYVRDRRSMIDSPSGAGQTKHQSLLAQFHFLWSLAHLAEGLSRPAGTLCTLQRKSSYFIESPLRIAKKTFVPCWSPFAPCRKPFRTLQEAFEYVAENFCTFRWEFLRFIVVFQRGRSLLMRTTGSYQGPVKSTSFLYKIEIWPHFLFEPTRSKACIFFCSCNWLECNELQTVFDIFVTTWLSDDNNAASSLK